MSVDRKLLEILCCPVSHTPLQQLDSKRLARLNQAIEAGEIQTVDGEARTEPLSEALVTIDDKLVYPVEDSIPIMLHDRAIGTTQLKDFSR